MMSASLTRTEYKTLARKRLSDAKALLKTGRNDTGAYYIAGYVVECALKACIAKQTKLYQYPPRDGASYYTHNVQALLGKAGLTDLLKTERQTNSTLDTNWKAVEQWAETSRYEVAVTRIKAQEIIDAIEDPVNGVLQWISAHW